MQNIQQALKFVSYFSEIRSNKMNNSGGREVEGGNLLIVVLEFNTNLCQPVNKTFQSLEVMKAFTVNDIAFVTGGGNGIGRATCQLLAEQGATVVVADINKKSADETTLNLDGKNHLSIHLDVSKKDDVRAAIRDVITKYSSPPNIAINCAGLGLHGSLLDVTEDTYNKIFDVNFKGTLWVTQTVCRELVSANMKGSVVNISSIAVDGFLLAAVYSATKGAVESFSRSLAKEFGPSGIRVNVVSPGLIDTAMSSKNIPVSEIQLLIEQTPLKRQGKPKEVAELIAFLASNKSSYVNGAVVKVNGGYK